MIRLIDADALSKRLQKLWNIHDDTDFANKDVWHELENAPAIDAVQVVRCKDCKYYKENTLVCSRYGLEDDDYCSWAERRES